MKALIVCGGWDGHEPFQVGDIFKDLLEKEGYDVDKTDTLDAFADLDYLMGLDLIIPIWTMGEINGDYVTNVLKAVESGVGLAGCHGGMCDAFRNDTRWQFMTGSQWVEHPGGDGVEYEVNINKASDSLIVKGINDFKVKTEQYYIHVDPGVNVLATTRFDSVEGPHLANGAVTVPVMYTKRWGKGKIFYSSLGHVANVFDNYEAKETMRRGMLWAAKGE